MSAESSVEDLQKQLDDYEGQLQMVEAALSEDPNSAEFLEVKVCPTGPSAPNTYFTYFTMIILYCFF